MSQTLQKQTIQLQVIADESGNNLVPLALRRESQHREREFRHGRRWKSSGAGFRILANLHGTFTEVPIGVKAPTWLWIPTDNSTVNGLPVGLEQYTGEQSFNLVVANVSSSITPTTPSHSLGEVRRAPITLSTGLNDFLVPRSQLLVSPFGQAILLGKGGTLQRSIESPPSRIPRSRA